MAKAAAGVTMGEYPQLDGPLSPEMENLALFYRTMTTQQLEDYLAALRADRTDALRLKNRPSRHTAAFSAQRIVIITRVLRERGVTVG